MNIPRIQIVDFTSSQTDFLALLPILHLELLGLDLHIEFLDRSNEGLLRLLPLHLSSLLPSFRLQSIVLLVDPLDFILEHILALLVLPIRLALLVVLLVLLLRFFDLLLARLVFVLCDPVVVDVGLVISVVGVFLELLVHVEQCVAKFPPLVLDGANLDERIQEN